MSGVVPIDGVDFEALRPTMDRMRRVAKALFNCKDAEIVIVGETCVWRSNGEPPRRALALSGIDRLSRDGAIWLVDARKDAHLLSNTRRRASLPRFYAAAPIVCEDGRTIGMLAVTDDQPREPDADLADRLQDLAAMVGHEFDRARAMIQRDLAMDRMERTQQCIELAVDNAGMHLYEMDFVKGELFKVGDESEFFDRPRTYDDRRADIWGAAHPDDRDQMKAAWQKHRAEGEPFRCEYRLNRFDGKEVWVLTHAELFEDEDGNPLRLIGAMQNITERKRGEAAMGEAKEAAETANNAKSAFLATMSHEIRTPLNGVLGMAQAMAADDLTDIQRERLTIVRESGEILLAILNDVLDLSKIEAGKLEIETIDFDLGEIAQGALAAFSALAGRKGLDFSFDIQGAEGVYRGDPTRIRQILYNLISNALKFTEAGEISVRAKRLADGLSITVSDSGLGIPSDRLATLFDKFIQVDATTTRRYGGTGLGLAICRELAEAMRGGVAVSSAPGVGSDFTLSLPLPRVGEGKRLCNDLSLETHMLVAPAEIRILAAEDNKVNQIVLKTLLNQIGVEPVLVSNGEMAVEAWERQDWDLILMDIQMPEMDGPTATRIIRERELVTRRPRTPIVALTANAMSHQISGYFDAGMDGHIGKPIEAKKLFEIISAILAAPAEEPLARAS